jgi:hypothetical protein
MFWKNLKNQTGEGHLTNGDETIDVGAAVQRVEGDDVSTLSLRLHLDLVIVFLDKATTNLFMWTTMKCIFKDKPTNTFTKM